MLDTYELRYIAYSAIRDSELVQILAKRIQEVVDNPRIIVDSHNSKDSSLMSKEEIEDFAADHWANFWYHPNPGGLSEEVSEKLSAIFLEELRDWEEASGCIYLSKEDGYLDSAYPWIVMQLILKDNL